MQGFADAVDTDNLQIVSIYPGSVRSEAVMKSKWANAPIAWNTGELPAHLSGNTYVVAPFPENKQ